MRIVILGGGITGLFSSYYLAKSGHSVTIVNKEVPGVKTSMYNGGLIVPSFAPTPVSVWEIVSMNLGRQGPVHISPREVLRNFRWFRTALRKGVSASEKTLITFGKRSLELYNDFFKEESIDVDLIRGVLGVYKSSEQARETARSLNGRYIDSQAIADAGFKGLDGGVLFEDELSINPAKLLPGITHRLGEMGVRMVGGEVIAPRVENGRANSVVVNDEELRGDIFVITSGAWAGQICRPLRLNPMVLPARGLAMIFDTGGAKVAGYPALLEDYGIGLVQHNERTVRVTSFFDFVGFKAVFGDSQKKWVREAIEKHLKESARLRQVEEGIGYRPCTPDQLPIIGKIHGYENVYIATGNCRLGVTLAPGTGYMIKSMVDGDMQRDEIAAYFDPARFSTRQP